MSIWYWAALGLFLGIAELFSGTAYLLWLAIAAFITACISWIFPDLNLTIQASMFAFLAVASTLLWFLRNKYRITPIKSATLNQRAKLLIGRKITLTEDIQDFRGHVMLDGVLWRIKANENYPAGTLVEVKTVDTTVLVVHIIK